MLRDSPRLLIKNPLPGLGLDLLFLKELRFEVLDCILHRLVWGERPRMGEDGAGEEPEDRGDRLSTSVVSGDDQVDIIRHVVCVADGDYGYAEFPRLDDRLGVGEWVCDEDELSVDMPRVEVVGEGTGQETTYLQDGTWHLAELTL